MSRGVRRGGSEAGGASPHVPAQAAARPVSNLENAGHSFAHSWRVWRSLGPPCTAPSWGAPAWSSSSPAGRSGGHIKAVRGTCKGRARGGRRAACAGHNPARRPAAPCPLPPAHHGAPVVRPGEAAVGERASGRWATLRHKAQVPCHTRVLRVVFSSGKREKARNGSVCCGMCMPPV